jgi:phenylpropionate dioxygenase-like ring-hydroxylating dioxygenase large terminal subunit
MAPLEHERILLRSWQIVCHANGIPDPGDFAVLDIGPDSAFVVRGQDGEIRGFHNVCRHRASRLVDGSGHCRRNVTCPYHGWSYGLDGKLVGVTLGDSLPGLDRAELGLLPVRTEVLLGFVFVCFAGDPQPLAEAWGGFLDELRGFRLEELVPRGPVYSEDWDVDWKVVMDNYLESYHVPTGHPGLYRMFTPSFGQVATLPSGVGSGLYRMRERPSPRWSESQYHKHVAETATHLPEDERRTWRYYSMLPNFGLGICPDQVDFFQVLPRGPGKSTIRGCAFALPDERREMRLLRYLNDRINRGVQREDYELCARVQRGVGSSGYRPGPLSLHEASVVDFHDLIRDRIPAAREDAPPAQLA